MKAYYLLAQAQLALHHPNEALSSAMTAYEECLKSPYNPSTSMVSALVLQAKKEKWEAKERERIRRRSEMLRDLEQALKKNADDEFQSLELRLQNGEVSESEGAEERQEVESETNKKIEELWLLFEVADPANMKRRVSIALCIPNVKNFRKFLLTLRITKQQIPDYMIDNISFEVMHDPVTTKNGQSYDKSTILEHLRRSETDPMTRQPLRHADLRPNLALKQACEEFLENNGWVVDW